MKGDFSRLNLFDSLKQYTRVMQQQGRVQLDADWNEQVDILLHYLRALAADLIGPFGGPAGKEYGFQITNFVAAKDKAPANLDIGAGRYYVDGLLCESHPADGKPVSYRGQPYADDLPETPFLVYLDVWERHVTYLQDGSLREVALGGADTTTRAQVTWRVRATHQGTDGKPINPDLTKEGVWDIWPDWVKSWKSTGGLKAQAKLGGDDTDPCTVSPEASYRGTENQLYRVEIQSWDGVDKPPAFKWSRENGCVAFAIASLEGDVVTVASLGRDDASGLGEGDWVEIVDDDLERAGLPGPLRQVNAIDAAAKTVTLAAVDDQWKPKTPEYDNEKGEAVKKHALLRRWDHQASSQANANGAALAVFPDAKAPGWLKLEKGIQIQFQPGTYRPGDYWLIPARTATGDVEWPQEAGGPKAMPPHGVEHHYAPLALIEAAQTVNLRWSFALTITKGTPPS